MVVRGHLQREIGDREQGVEQVIDAVVLTSRALHEGAAVVLTSDVAHYLVHLHSSGR